MRRITTLTLGIALCAVLFLATVHGGNQVADAQAQVSPPGPGGITPSSRDMRQAIHQYRQATNEALVRKCREPRRHYAYPNVWKIPSPLVRPIFRYWQGERARVRGLESRCSNPRAVIRMVFGARAGPAIRIVRCETGGTFDRFSVGDAGERGWWQVHPQHFDYVDEARLWEPLYSTRLAWRWSEHGTDFSPTWTCATRLGIA